MSQQLAWNSDFTGILGVEESYVVNHGATSTGFTYVTSIKRVSEYMFYLEQEIHRGNRDATYKTISLMKEDFLKIGQVMGWL